MKYILTLLILSTSALIYSCAIKEENVSENRVAGLYLREVNEEKEYLCLRNDYSYSYYLENSGLEKILTKGVWVFDNTSGRSYLTLKNFNYSMALKKYSADTSGIAVPIKYSHSYNAVLLRMDADSYSQDFVRIDSISCSLVK